MLPAHIIRVEFSMKTSLGTESEQTFHRQSSFMDRHIRVVKDMKCTVVEDIPWKSLASHKLLMTAFEAPCR